MPKRVVDFHDSVEFTGDWEFVKQKKERIIVRTQKAVNSEIYMTFNEVIPLYAFLYFSLAPEEAFGFQKVQPIFEKMRGETEESKQQFEECKRALSLNWDGVTPLTNLIRQHKKHIIREQKSIYNISSRITEEQVKQLIKSGLSQRKIHLDYHTNDGQEQEAIIPTVENINNCVSIIYEERNHKYLLAFFSHIQEQEKNTQQKSAQQPKIQSDNEIHNHPQTFKDRPLPTRQIQNPDDRPLPPPQKQYYSNEATHTSHANQRQPNFERTILNPDDKLLPPPSNDKDYAGVPRTSPRNYFNPDERLLPQPPKPDPKDKKLAASASSSKIPTKQTPTKPESRVNELKTEVKHLGQVAGEKIHDLGERAKHLAERVEDRVEEIVDDIRHEKHDWLQLGVAAAIIGLAIKVLRE